MPILTLGVSYREAPLDLLERLAFPQEELPKAYRRLGDDGAVREAVVLSTCNRVEVTAEVPAYHAGLQALRRFMSEAREVGPEEFAEPAFALYEDEAVRHLFDVAAGLDSMVVGEPQILTQVRQAFRHAESEGATGSTTSALFRAAVRTGRRVRAETAVGASPGAFVEAGADLAGRWLAGLRDRSAVVVGAGQMAVLAVAHLRDRGVGRIRVVNRTPERARGLAARAGAEAHGLDGLRHALHGADVVVTCTGAAGIVVTRQDVEFARAPGAASVAASTTARRMALIDLAVPRDVDPDAARLPGVLLADIDAIAVQLASTGPDPTHDLDRAGEIVRAEVERFASWRRASRLAPLIQGLRDAGERAAQAELARLGPRLAGPSGPDRDAAETLARGVVAKLLHGPIVRLKGAAAGEAHARALAELFGIEYDPDD